VFIDRLTSSAAARSWFENQIHLEHPNYPSTGKDQGAARATGTGLGLAIPPQDGQPIRADQGSVG
jgi:hypothetical protein